MFFSYGLWWRLPLAFLLRRPVVALKDWDNTVCCRIAKETPFGDLIAERIGMNIHPVTLLPDGTIKGHKRPSEYVQTWKYLDNR